MSGKVCTHGLTRCQMQSEEFRVVMRGSAMSIVGGTAAAYEASNRRACEGRRFSSRAAVDRVLWCKSECKGDFDREEEDACWLTRLERDSD